MKRSIKLLICILIAMLIIPLNSYANTVPSKDASLEEITAYVNDLTEDDLKAVANIIPEDNLIAWLSEVNSMITTPEDYRQYKGSQGEWETFKSEVKKARETIMKIIMFKSFLIAEDKNINRYDYFNKFDNETLAELYKNMNNYLVLEVQNARITAMQKIEEVLRNRGIKPDEISDVEIKDYKDSDDFQDIYDEESLNYWKPTSTGDNKKLQSLASRILGLIQTVGSIISVVTLVVMGIKYMFASVSEKAKYKETMIPYIVGCVMLFATSNIAAIIYKVATDL